MYVDKTERGSGEGTAQRGADVGHDAAEEQGAASRGQSHRGWRRGHDLAFRKLCLGGCWRLG